MFYSKRLLHLRSQPLRVKIPFFAGPDKATNQALMQKTHARLCYNYRLCDGGIKTGMGLKRAQMPFIGVGTPFTLPRGFDGTPTNTVDRFLQLMIYPRTGPNDRPDDRIIARNASGFFYECSLREPSRFTRLQFERSFERVEAVPYRYNGRDVLLIAAERGLFMHDGLAQPRPINGAPRIESMCVHYERVYASLRGDSTGIFFSSAFDPTDWDIALNKGGFIDFADEGGYVRRVVQYLDSVYIFRDFSVERLIAYGDQTEFMVTKICTLGAKIIPNTIVLCGSRILFMLRDGLYEFDGFTPKKIFGHLTDLIDTGHEMSACFFHDKYYLAVKADFNDGKKILGEATMVDGYKNALFEFDLNSRVVNIMRGVLLKDIVTVKFVTAEKVIAIAQSTPEDNERGDLLFEICDDGCFMGDKLPAFWQTAYNTLGMADRRKVLRKYSLVSKHPIELTVEANGQSQVHKIEGGSGPTEVIINTQCSSWSNSFASEGGADVSDAVMNMEVL